MKTNILKNADIPKWMLFSIFVAFPAIASAMSVSTTVDNHSDNDSVTVGSIVAVRYTASGSNLNGIRPQVDGDSLSFWYNNGGGFFSGYTGYNVVNSTVTVDYADIGSSDGEVLLFVKLDRLGTWNFYTDAVDIYSNETSDFYSSFHLNVVPAVTASTSVDGYSSTDTVSLNTQVTVRFSGVSATNLLHGIRPQVNGDSFAYWYNNSGGLFTSSQGSSSVDSTVSIDSVYISSSTGEVVLIITLDRTGTWSFYTDVDDNYGGEDSSFYSEFSLTVI